MSSSSSDALAGTQSQGLDADSGGTEIQPFVRLSKAEKKKMKYERAKAQGQMKRKKARDQKREKLAKVIESSTKEERLARRASIAAEAAARDEHLTTALREGPRIGIDLSFSNDDEESANSAQETASLAKQLNYVYASLRRREISVQLHFTSYQGLAAEALGKGGANGWQVYRHAKPLEEVFKLEDIVYLSPDAEDELGMLDRAKVYVVGGIVDRTPSKGLSKDKASKLRVATARLPLGLLAGIKTKNLILNVDTVVAALASWYSSNGDWTVALEKVLPQRHLEQGRGNFGSKKRKPESTPPDEDDS